MSSITLMLAMVAPSWATTWTVTSGMSIQSAINGASNGDTIEVNTGTYTECLDPNGRDISIQGIGSVLINGNSCSTVTVGGSEVLEISDLELQNTSGLVLEVTSSNASVSLSNINVSSSGYTSQGPNSFGGVVYTEGAVSIEGSNFSSNTGGLGGVIYADGGSVSIVNSTFSGNSALKGAVLYARDGTVVTSTNNTYENNWTVNGGFGGLYGRFDTRYTAPKTTKFISQPYGGTEFDLFHFEHYQLPL